MIDGQIICAGEGKIFSALPRPEPDHRHGAAAAHRQPRPGRGGGPEALRGQAQDEAQVCGLYLRYLPQDQRNIRGENSSEKESDNV